MNRDDFFMSEALKSAREAESQGEVPVGAVIVYNEKVLARAYNQREKTQNPLAHAELLVIEQASQKLRSWRLESCELYVTLEPCEMCLGACKTSRVSRLVYGCEDSRQKRPKDLPFEICKGVFKEECSSLLRSFFKELR